MTQIELKKTIEKVTKCFNCDTDCKNYGIMEFFDKTDKKNPVKLREEYYCMAFNDIITWTFEGDVLIWCNRFDKSEKYTVIEKLYNQILKKEKELIKLKKKFAKHSNNLDKFLK